MFQHKWRSKMYRPIKLQNRDNTKKSDVNEQYWTNFKKFLYLQRRKSQYEKEGRYTKEKNYVKSVINMNY